jgi:hypothetical protein
MVERELRIHMLVAALAGVVAWSGPAPLIPLSLALPILCSSRPRRGHRANIAFAYYAAALWPVIAAGVQLYGWHAIPFLLVVTGLATSVLVACWLLPGAVLPLIVTAVPPIGIIGVANPLTSAGILFPGTSWVGLIATALIPFGIARRPACTVPTVLVLTLTLNGIARVPAPPAGWRGVDTNFGDIRNKKDTAAEFRSAEWIQQAVRSSDAQVLVLPELAVTRWTEATEAFWQPTLAKLGQQRRTLILGAGLPIHGGQEYWNVLMAVPFHRSTETASVAQSIPLPWVMWNPIAAKDRVPLSLWGRRTLRVSGERAAALICYEQLVVWPVFTAVSERPTVLVAISNAVWTKNTPIPAVQASTIWAWSRLFDIPAISAVNQ